MKWTRPVVEGSAVGLRTRHSAVAVHSDYEEHARGETSSCVILSFPAVELVFLSLSFFVPVVSCVWKVNVFFFFWSGLHGGSHVLLGAGHGYACALESFAHWTLVCIAHDPAQTPS